MFLDAACLEAFCLLRIARASSSILIKLWDRAMASWREDEGFLYRSSRNFEWTYNVFLKASTAILSGILTAETTISISPLNRVGFGRGLEIVAKDRKRSRLAG